MRNKYKFIIAFLFFVFIGGMISSKLCYAASAEVEITSDATSVTVGDDFFVYIKINSSTTFGDFEANLSYNNELLDFVKGGSAITGSNGFLKISDIGVLDGNNSRKYTMKFKALKVGDCELSFPHQAMVYEYESGNEMSVSSNILTINVKPKRTASENTNLKSLKISPSELNPAFDKNIHEYTTTVGNETERLIVDAVPEDQRATVSISGNDFLKEGENKVNVSVLAESGTVIEYTINVNREKAAVKQITPIASTDLSQGTFHVVTVNGENYAVYSGKYKLIEPDNTVKIPEGFTKTSITMSDITMTAYAPENNQNAEILLIYAENESGEKSFYYFDRVEKTMLRYVANHTLDSSVNASNGTESMKPDINRKQLNVTIIIIILLSGICILLTIVIIRLFMKLKGYKYDDLD